MADVDVRLNPQLEHLSALLCKAAAGAAAQRIATAARAAAPVATGRYQSRIDVNPTPEGAKVVARDQKSAWIEFGIPSRGIPAQFVLRRAAETAGYKLRTK